MNFQSLYQGRWLVFVCTSMLLYSAANLADQEVISSYKAAGPKAYSLYVGVPAYVSADIYCGIHFTVDPEDPRRPEEWLSLEHAYPADWMADFFGCENREECRRHPDLETRARFNHAEADLHNLWPAHKSINSARGKKPFGEIPGDEIRDVDANGETYACKYQSEDGIVEPRKIARGNLARSIFYMCAEYGFPVDPEMFAVLQKWNKSDPPTKAEIRRNNEIYAIQGTLNPYIENPSLVASLECGD